MKELLKLKIMMAVTGFFNGGGRGLLGGSYPVSSDTGHHNTGRGRRNKARVPNDGRWHMKHHRSH